MATALQTFNDRLTSASRSSRQKTGGLDQRGTATIASAGSREIDCDDGQVRTSRPEAPVLFAQSSRSTSTAAHFADRGAQCDGARSEKTCTDFNYLACIVGRPGWSAQPLMAKRNAAGARAHVSSWCLRET